MKHKSVIEIGYSELERLVQDKLGFKDYSFAATEECGNDSDHQFDVDGKLDKWDKENIQEWKDGESPTFTNPVILNELCRLGHIKKGEYIVTVCW